MVVLLRDQEAIFAARSDQILADDVVGAADSRPPWDSEADAPASASDDVAGDQVAASLLDGDAVPTSGDAVSGDHVSVPGGNANAGAVSNEAVATHPITVGVLKGDSDIGVA